MTPSDHHDRANSWQRGARIRDRDPPLSLPCRRARGECVVLNLRHFVPILSTQVLVSSVVFVSITAVLHHFWASSPLAGPLTATHCGCASCAMACGGTLSAPAGGVARSACIAGETRKAGYSHHVAKPVVVLILSFDHHCHWRSLRSLLFETATPRPYAPSPKCTKPSARTLNCSRHGRFTWTCI